jgi:hypothetical protein
LIHIFYFLFFHTTFSGFCFFSQLVCYQVFFLIATTKTVPIMTNGGISISVVIILLLHLSDIHVQAAPPLKFSFNDFVMNRDGYRFEFAGSGASIDLGALQITPDTSNGGYSFNNQYGRIMYKQPYTMWLSDDTQASFNSTFVINISTEQNWTAGEGLAFLIAPDLSIPQASDGRWLGLTNSTNDGNNTNQIVAIEFDTCTARRHRS